MKNPLRLSFVRDVAITGGAQATQAVCAMLGGILVARFLGASAKGELTVLVALGSMAVLLASLGIHQSSIYFLGRHQSERDAIVSNNVVFALAGGLVTATLLGVAGFVFQRQLLHGIALSLFFAYLVAVPFNYINEFVRRTILGTGRVTIFNVPDLVQGGSLFLGTALVILLFGEHVLPLVLLRVVTEIGTAIFMVAYLWRVVRFRLSPSWQLLVRQLRYGLKNYASSLFWLFLFSSDAVLCNHFLGNARTGVYSVAVSLGMPITMLGAVIGTLTFQRVAAETSAQRRISSTNRVVRLLVPIAGLTVIATGALAPLAIPIVYGSQFSGATVALLLLLPGLLALTLETVVMNFLAGDGSPPIVYWGPFIGLVLNLGANLYVIPHYGINGAAATSSVGYIVVFGLVLAYYLRWTQSRLSDVLFPRKVDIATLLRTGPKAHSATPPEAQAA